MNVFILKTWWSEISSTGPFVCGTTDTVTFFTSLHKHIGSQGTSSLRTHRLHSPSDFDTAIQLLGANHIILGFLLEEMNFRVWLPSPRAARCLQSDCLQSNVRIELELRDHIYQQIFSQVASLHAVNYMDHKRPETRAFPVPRCHLAYRLHVWWIRWM